MSSSSSSVLEKTRTSPSRTQIQQSGIQIQIQQQEHDGSRELIRSVSDAEGSSAILGSAMMPKHHHHLHHPHLPGHSRRKEQGHSATLGLVNAGGGGGGGADYVWDGNGRVEGRVDGIGFVAGGSRRGSRLVGGGGRDVSGRDVSGRDVSGRDREDYLDGNVDGGEVSWREKREKLQIKPGQVEREKEKSALRASELRESLIELNTFSNTTTRQLDTTYYSILEKHTLLQSTIASMQDLTLATRKISQDFSSSESKDIVSEIESQLQGFHDFESQRRQIEGFARRVEGGRERVEGLCERLERVRARVERWERCEGEWQLRTRRRLRILWAGVVSCVLVFVVLLVFQHLPLRGGGKGDGVVLAKQQQVAFDVLRHEELGGDRGNRTGVGGKMGLFGGEERGEVYGEDPRLRLFDEL